MDCRARDCVEYKIGVRASWEIVLRGLGYGNEIYSEQYGNTHLFSGESAMLLLGKENDVERMELGMKGGEEFGFGGRETRAGITPRAKLCTQWMAYLLKATFVFWVRVVDEVDRQKLAKEMSSWCGMQDALMRRRMQRETVLGQGVVANTKQQQRSRTITKPKRSPTIMEDLPFLKDNVFGDRLECTLCCDAAEARMEQKGTCGHQEGKVFKEDESSKAEAAQQRKQADLPG